MRKRQTRRRYPAEFRRDAVELVRANPEASIRELAERLGMNETTLGLWYRQDDVKRTKKKKKRRRAPDSPETPDERVARLERENRQLLKKVAQLEMDREILKKAAAFFAKENE